MLNTSQRLTKQWRCLQDVFARGLEDVLKTSWRRLCKTSCWCLEDVLKLSWRRLENVLKTFLQEVLKTFWNYLEDIWTKRIYWSWPRRLKDVFWWRIIKKSIFVFIKTSWRRLEDVFWTRRRKTSSRCHWDVCIRTNVCWVRTNHSVGSRVHQLKN